MTHPDLVYHGMLKEVLETGRYKMDRTRTGVIQKFGMERRYDLTEGFLLLTTKKIPFGLIKSENLWFISGETNIRGLLQHNNHIWDEWAFLNYIQSPEYKGTLKRDFGIRAAKDPAYKKQVKEEMEQFTQRILEDEEFAMRYGDLGPVYGKQWRQYRYYDEYTGRVETVDQLEQAIELIRNQPESRRIIVDAWHPGYIKYQALPPCHKSFQFDVTDGKLSCLLEQRSVDLFLGAPFNIAGYALLTHMIAQVTGLEVGEFIHHTNDTHIYVNHLDQVKLQMEREPFPLPKLVLNPAIKKISDFKFDDIRVEGYQSHPSIQADVAV